MLANVFFDQLNCEAIRGTAYRCNEIQYLAARSIFFKTSLNCLNLAFEPPYAREQFFIGIYMRHKIGGYPIICQCARTA